MLVDVLDIASIETADWQPQLGSIGTIVEDMDDIDQCIRTILTTPKGSVPHAPEFGSDLWQYVDWPIDQARPQIVREIVESIERWEPRVEMTAITADSASDDPTTAIIQITRRRRGSLEQASVLVLRVAP